MQQNSPTISFEVCQWHLERDSVIREKREKKLRRRVWLAGKQRGLGRRDGPFERPSDKAESCVGLKGGRVSENRETRWSRCTTTKDVRFVLPEKRIEFLAERALDDAVDDAYCGYPKQEEGRRILSLPLLRRVPRGHWKTTRFARVQGFIYSKNLSNEIQFYVSRPKQNIYIHDTEFWCCK